MKEQNPQLEHQPLPWHAAESGLPEIYDAAGDLVTAIGNDMVSLAGDRENMALILNSVNGISLVKNQEPASNPRPWRERQRRDSVLMIEDANGNSVCLMCLTKGDPSEQEETMRFILNAVNLLRLVTKKRNAK